MTKNSTTIFLSFLLALINIPLLFDPDTLMSKYFLKILIVISGFFILKNVAIMSRYKFEGFIDKQRSILFALLLSYVLLIIVSYIRAYLALTLTFPEAFYTIILLVSLFLLLLTSTIIYKNSANLALYSLSIYIGLNLLLKFIGIDNPYSTGYLRGQATILSSMGIDINRILFPLGGGGATNFGTVSGLLSALALVLFIVTKHRKLHYVIIFLISAAIVLVTDTRGAMLSIFLTILVLLFFQLQKKIIHFFTPLLILLLPFLSTFLSILSDVAFYGAVRPGEDSLGRILIWRVAVSELADFSTIHLIGFGAYGQTTSRVSYGYSFLFKDWLSDRPELFSLHNIALQTVFDIGYIGLIILLVILAISMNIASNMKTEVKYILMAGLLFMMCAGSHDISLSFYSREVFIVFLLFVFTCIFYDPQEEEQNYAKENKEVISLK